MLHAWSTQPVRVCWDNSAMFSDRFTSAPMHDRNDFALFTMVSKPGPELPRKPRLSPGALWSKLFKTFLGVRRKANSHVRLRELCNPTAGLF